MLDNIKYLVCIKTIDKLIAEKKYDLALDKLNYLIKHNIYCNVHWRLTDKAQNSASNYLSHNLITIPCDQRYSEKEMDYIVKVIRKWEKKNDRIQIRC